MKVLKRWLTDPVDDVPLLRVVILAFVGCFCALAFALLLI